jgi:hypothetical protein
MLRVKLSTIALTATLLRALEPAESVVQRGHRTANMKRSTPHVYATRLRWDRAKTNNIGHIQITMAPWAPLCSTHKTRTLLVCGGRV